jgi:hypothetical protein
MFRAYLSRTVLSFIFFTAACVYVNPTFPQTAPTMAEHYITRMQLVTQQAEGRIADDCVVVFGTGSFRREQRLQHPKVLESGLPGARVVSEPPDSIKVFEGQLSADELARLRSLLEAGNIRAINPPESQSTRHPLKDQMFTLSIYGDGEEQRLRFWDKDSLSPYKKELGPALDWFSKMKNHAARKTDAKPNGCDEAATLP